MGRRGKNRKAETPPASRPIHWTLRRVDLFRSSNPLWPFLIFAGLAILYFAKRLPEVPRLGAATVGILVLAGGLAGAGRGAVSGSLLGIGLVLAWAALVAFPHSQVVRIPYAKRLVGVPFVVVWTYDLFMSLALLGSVSYGLLASSLESGGAKLVLTEEPEEEE